jgi:hypothetical protein
MAHSDRAGNRQEGGKLRLFGLWRVATSGMGRRFEMAPRNAVFTMGPAASGAVWPRQNRRRNPSLRGDLTRPATDQTISGPVAKRRVG